MSERKPQAQAVSVSRKQEPEWMARCREELMKLDPRYVVVFNIRWRRFGGDCTAAQLHRALRQQGFDWAPTNPATTRKWLVRIQRVEVASRQPSSPVSAP